MRSACSGSRSARRSAFLTARASARASNNPRSISWARSCSAPTADTGPLQRAAAAAPCCSPTASSRRCASPWRPGAQRGGRSHRLRAAGGARTRRRRRARVCLPAALARHARVRSRGPPLGGGGRQQTRAPALLRRRRRRAPELRLRRADLETSAAQTRRARACPTRCCAAGHRPRPTPPEQRRNSKRQGRAGCRAEAKPARPSNESVTSMTMV
jgi:hypothetical protein